jgi:hypothetical protein
MEIEVSLCRPHENDGTCIAMLKCGSEDFPFKKMAILLRPDGHGLYAGTFIGKYCHKIEFIDQSKSLPSPYVVYIRRVGEMFYEEVG